MLHAQQKPQPQNSEHAPLPSAYLIKIAVQSPCRVNMSSNRLCIDAREWRLSGVWLLTGITPV
jgi:hypothetical protein